MRESKNLLLFASLSDILAVCLAKSALLASSSLVIMVKLHIKCQGRDEGMFGGVGGRVGGSGL